MDARGGGFNMQRQPTNSWGQLFYNDATVLASDRIIEVVNVTLPSTFQPDSPATACRKAIAPGGARRASSEPSVDRGGITQSRE